MGICLKGLPRSVSVDVQGEFLPVDNALKDVIFQGVEFPSMSFVRVDLDPRCDRVMREIIGLSDQTEALIEIEMRELDDTECDRRRTLLSETYEKFVSQFGLLSSYRKWFESDDCFWLDYRAIAYALSLEIENSPAPILSRRVINPATSPITLKFTEGSEGDRTENAFRYWQAKGNRRPDLDALSVISGIDRDTVKFHLLDRRLCYRSVCMSGDSEDSSDEFTEEILETAQEFLSGNIRSKYSKYLELEGYDKEKEDLEKILPPDIAIAHIAIPLGVQWVPPAFYEQWIMELLQLRAKLEYYPELSYWMIQVTEGCITNYYNHTSCAFVWVDPEELGVQREQRIEAIDLIRKVINNENVTISLTARTGDGKKTKKKSAKLTKDCIAKMQLLSEDWERWAKEKCGKALENIYNQEFNSIQYPSWEGAGEVLSLEGMSNLWKDRLRQYQKDAIARSLTGNTLLGLGVGLGKTISACGAVGVRYLLGACRKALIVVQKSTLSGFAKTFREAYPQIPVYAASVSDLSKKKRYRFLAGIAFRDNGVWIMSHDSFDAIGIRNETEAEFISERLQAVKQEIEIAELSPKKRDRHCSKLKRLLEVKRLRYEARLKELGQTYDIGLRFEDLGVEYLVIDECDRYKNDEIVTRLAGLAGVCTNHSDRAASFSIKCSWMNRRFEESALLFMSGTPEPDNWLGGVFVYQRYLQPSTLKGCGIDNFDAWARSFTRISHDFEIKASGMVKETSRLSELINVPELGRMWLGGVCHIVRYEWIADQISESERRPEMEFIEVACPPTEVQSAIAEWLVMRDREVRNLRPMVIPKYNNQGELVSVEGKVILDPQTGKPIISLRKYMELGGDKKLPKIKAIVDGFYPICHESRCNAIAPQLLPVNSLRMMGLPPDPPVEATQKIAEAVHKILFEYEYDRGETLQMIFCDIGVAGGTSRFSVYEWMADRLVEGGIPRQEIAFVQTAKNEDEFDAIIDRARKMGGDRINVLFSSTQKGGVGLNVQDRLRVLHCIDIPQKPSLIEQRIGRPHRSGNRCPKIKVYQYFTQGSGGNNHGGDAYLFQMNNIKNRAKEVFWRNDSQLRTIVDDSSRVAYLSLMAQACGGEEFFEYCKLAEEVRKLKVRKVDMERDLARWRSDEDRLIKEIDLLKDEIDGIAIASDRVKLQVAGCTGKNFCVEIGGEKIDGIRNAEKALRDQIDVLSERCLKSNGRSLCEDIGIYGGLNVRAIVVQTGVRLSVTTCLVDDDFRREFSWVKSLGLLAKKMEEAIIFLSNQGSRMKRKLENKRQELRSCQDRSAKLTADYPITVDRYTELADRQTEMELRLNIERDS